MVGSVVAEFYPREPSDPFFGSVSCQAAQVHSDDFVDDL